MAEPRRLTPDRARPGAADERSDAELVAMGQRVLRGEASALAALADGLGEPFATAVRWAYACEGRLLVTGLGKSGIVARKIAGTLTSTGTPALFVHPVEALHGDLGLAGSGDMLLAISRGGANPEILALQGTLGALGVRCIALTTDQQSPLAQRSELVLYTPVEREACPLGLTPTTSTTAALAMGDALAMALLELRDFRREDFAVFHPSGSLGHALRTTVAQLMHAGDDLPVVPAGTPLREVLPVISAKRLGCTVVVDGEGRLAGFLSDGDLRRILAANEQPLDLPVDGFMSTRPVVVEEDCLARAALRTMESNPSGPISQLVVMRGAEPVGVVHLHDILALGLSS